MKRSPHLGLAGTIAQAFIGSKLTPLLITGSVLLGLLAIVVLPREEEPQIRVPVVDILLAMPGASAAEVESRVSAPLERLMWEIPGVEYVYSTSQPGRALIVVRYRVGENTEQSLVKLYQKLQANPDRIPPGASPPLVKARSVDDVPILALTFHSKRYDHLTLRRVAAQVDAEIKHVPRFRRPPSSAATADRSGSISTRPLSPRAGWEFSTCCGPSARPIARRSPGR